MLLAWTVFLLLLISQAKSSFKTHPYVLTTSGAVRGVRLKIPQREVHSFLGIPYGAPPIRDLRFRRPVSVAPWEGIYDATEGATPCFQRSEIPDPWSPPDHAVSEDCLYLNVWVPVTQDEKGNDDPIKAVMVWIHGGGFTIGASSLDLYNGETLAAHANVIVASMNYRLGVFGFLNAGTEDAPGNMGLYDQVLALQWIKDNIKAFGGDQDRITIFGESAGSKSIGFHLLSPLSHGLFTRAIMQSGTPLNPEWGTESPCVGPVIGDKFARAVGCSNDVISLKSHPHKVIACLKEIDPSTLSNAENSIFPIKMKHFLPHYGDDFMPIQPTVAIRDGRFNNTELLSGVTSNEGLLFLFIMYPEAIGAEKLPSLNADERKMVLTEAFIKQHSSVFEELESRYQNGRDQEAMTLAFFKSLGDFVVVCPTVVFSEGLSKAGSSVFFYYLDHQPSKSPLKPGTGMSHGDDIQFVFGLPLKNPADYTEEERDFSLSLMDIWTSFAKTGKPQFSENEVWPEFLPDLNYVELKPRNQEIRQGRHLEHCSFWKQHIQQQKET